jgi:hypothetical protein
LLRVCKTSLAVLAVLVVMTTMKKKTMMMPEEEVVVEKMEMVVLKEMMKKIGRKNPNGLQSLLLLKRDGSRLL